MIKLEVLEQLSHSFVRVITWFRVQFGMNQHEQIFNGTPICILWKIYECLFIHMGGPSSRLEKKASDLFMKASRVVWLGVKLREEPLRIWTRRKD